MAKGEKKKGGKLKVILIVVIVLIVLAAIGSGSNDKEPTKVDSNATVSESAENTTAASSEATEEATTFTVGDTADFDGVKIKLSAAILSAGGNYVKPDDGKYFLGLIFDIDNESDTDINVSSLASFEAYVDDYSVNLDLTGNTAPEFDGLDSLDGSVAAGKKMNGVICYQVPQDFQNFEVTVTADFWSDKKVTFNIPADSVDRSAIQ